MIDSDRTLLTLDPERHIYRMDGRVIPNVTMALQQAGIIDYSGVPASVLEAASERGKLVHKIADLAVTEWRDGAIDPASIRPEERGYLDAVRRFIDATGFQATLTECRIWEPTYGYAGTFDALGKDRHGDEWIPDWKSGMESDAHEIQAEAYAHGTGEPRRYRSPIVYLRPDGTFKIRWPKGGKLAVFASAVNCLNYRIGKGMWP